MINETVGVTSSVPTKNGTVYTDSSPSYLISSVAKGSINYKKSANEVLSAYRASSPMLSL